MLAYEVTLNDQKLPLAGMEDWSSMSIILSAVRDEQEDGGIDFTFHLGGMSLVDENDICYHARWEKPQMGIAVGSEIHIRIVESDDVSPPVRRYRSDREVQECPFTEEEMREMRYQDYLSLKAEFEAGG
jgi:hypothetical protein